MLHNHHPNLLPEHFITPKENSIPFKWSLHNTPLHPLITITWLSTSMDLFVIGISHKKSIQYVFFSVWFLLLSVMFFEDHRVCIYFEAIKSHSYHNGVYAGQ